MLGFVSQEKYDAEHELRLRAESEATALREQVKWLQEQIEEENERHQQNVVDVLDRFQPKPEALKIPPGTGIPPFLSSTEIFKIPAAGKRGMRERNRAALEAQAREEKEERQHKLESQREVLSEDELESVDDSIPV